MARDKIELIVIKDEFGNYKRLKVSKKLLKITGALSLASFLFLSAFSLVSLKERRESLKEKRELEQKVALLERELSKVNRENKSLKGKVAKLTKEKEETVKELAKRLELINSLIKKTGFIKVKKGEGGTAVPIEKVLTDSNIDLDALIPGIDKLIKDFRNTPLGYPTEGRITSKFGIRRNPITGRLEFHLGLDIANRWGTPVRATADGVVVKAGWCGLMGRCVEIQHDNGFKTYYGHLAKITVFKGQRVERGMIIGLMGNSGRSTGPHLHYSVKMGSKVINPLPFVEVKGVKEKG